MKFGGDCLSTPTNQIIVKDIIKSFKGKVIAVCSAMGREGFPYSTYNLNKICEENYISLKERDRLLSIGEIISSIRLSYILNSYGTYTYSLSNTELGLNCDNNYGNANIININNSKLLELIDKYEVLTLPGFIGLSNEQEIITLGRGNSDLTAVIISKMLKINNVILYKNVDGVYHTPPSVYKQLNLYDYLSYDEMILLNSIGFQIVSYKALIFAKENNIDIEIRNVLSNKKGTVISKKSSSDTILGFNITDKIVKIASFNVEDTRKLIKEELAKMHIFIKNATIENNIYTFEINKSILSNVKKILIKVMESVNKFRKTI